MGKDLITFAEEKITDALPDLMGLWEAHWNETEMYRHGEGFNMQVSRYIEYNNIGFYRLYIARIDGRMVGDIGVYITDSMHTGKRIAVEDTMYLSPEARKGRNAIKFIKYVQDQLREIGVVEVSTTVKLHNGAGKIFSYLGYRHIAEQYSKEL